MSSRRGLIACLAAVLVLNLQPASSRADPCREYADYTHPAAMLSLTEAYDVAISGTYAYVADGSPGLFVIDISDPRRPFVAGSVDTPNQAWGVCVSGSTAYVADMAAGLRIVDVSNPAAPVLLGGDLFAGAYDVAVSGNYAYVAASDLGVRVVNVANPAAPVMATVVDTPGYAYGVCLAGDRLYVADSIAGVEVYSLADPASPALLGTCDTADSATKVALSGQTLAVADYTGGLALLDVSDPAHVTTISVTPFFGYGARSVALTDDGLCLVGGDAGVQFLDVHDPAHPVDLGSLSAGDDILGVATDGAWAYAAADGMGLAVFDLGNRQTTRGLGTRLDTPGYATGVAADAGHVYLTAVDVGLQVFDLADPAAPTLQASLALPNFPGDLALSGSIVGVACSTAGLRLVDVSDPSTPTERGSLTGIGHVVGLARTGNTMYAATWDSLRAIDVTDPDNPHRLHAVRIAGEADWVAANEHGVFVGTLVGTVLWYVDTPGGFLFRCSTPIAGHSAGLAVQDTLLYAGYAYSGATTGVAIFGINDVSNELDPLGDLRVPGSVNRVTCADGILYLAEGSLLMVDARDPRAPRLIGEATGPPTAAAHAVVMGDYAYVADDDRGLTTVPRACATSVPVFLTTFGATSRGTTVELDWAVSESAVAGDFRLTARIDGLAWDVPVTAAGAGRWRATDAHPRLSAGGSVTYELALAVGDGTWRLLASRTVALPAARSAQLLAARPNPFNPQTTLPFVLQREGPARLAVYDAAGRLVAVLAEGVQAAGAHVAAWDGLDTRGRAAPSGVYFARLSTVGSVEERKLVLLR